MRLAVVDMSDVDVRDGIIPLAEAEPFLTKDVDGSGAVCVSFGHDAVQTRFEPARGTLADTQAMRDFVQKERVEPGDFLVLERQRPNEFHLWKTAKRVVKFHL